MSSLRLTRTITPTDHAPLHTLEEACAYLSSLPGEIATTPAWERAADLVLRVRKNPTEAALDELTSQLELALFLIHRIDLPEGIARPSRGLADDQTERWPTAPKGGSMKRLISAMLATLSVAFGIWIISRHYGGGVQTFVEWWCELIGVSNHASIQVATGIFSGTALIVIIYACCSLVAQLVWALLRGQVKK